MLDRLKQALLLGVGPRVGYLLLRFLWVTYRVRVDPDSAGRLAALSSQTEKHSPAIFAFWHDQIFASTPFLLKHLIASGREISVMISPSGDGELVSRTIRRLGVTVVRGSASRDGARALRALYRHVCKQRSSPVMLPDGPKGPAYVAKPGTVVLAQLTRAPIAPLAFRVDRAWTLGSWDKMKMPKPFARIDVRCAEPYLVPRRLTAEELDQQIDFLGERLQALRASMTE